MQQLPPRLKKPVPFLVEEMPTLKSRHVKKVLDLGCGVGRHCVYLAKEGFEVVGIDVSKSALKIANMWVQKEKLSKVALICGTMTNLPFSNCHFDAVIGISVIHHALKKDIMKIFTEIYRILKKNGTFLANLASVKDPRYGEGQKVENNTFKILEAFEERRFEELHHFFTKQEAYEMLDCFAKVRVELLSDKPNYWKITATK